MRSAIVFSVVFFIGLTGARGEYRKFRDPTFPKRLKAELKKIALHPHHNPLYTADVRKCAVKLKHYRLNVTCRAKLYRQGNKKPRVFNVRLGFRKTNKWFTLDTVASTLRTKKGYQRMVMKDVIRSVAQAVNQVREVRRAKKQKKGKLPRITMGKIKIYR